MNHYVIAVIFACILFYVIRKILSYIKERQRIKQLATYLKQQKDSFDRTLKTFAVKYGDCTNKIYLDAIYSFDEFPNKRSLRYYILIYEKSRIIIIQGQAYSFSDIVGYEKKQDKVNDTMSYLYNIYINTNNISNPSIHIYFGNDGTKFQQVGAILNIILERNKNR